MRQKIRLFDFFEAENPSKPAGYAWQWSDEPGVLQLKLTTSVVSRAKAKGMRELIFTRFPGDEGQCVKIPIMRDGENGTALWKNFM
jgi:hypothetical protein